MLIEFGMAIFLQIQVLLKQVEITSLELWQKELYARYNAITPKSATRPIAKIVSAVKTGTTTATITTDIPH